MSKKDPIDQKPVEKEVLILVKLPDGISRIAAPGLEIKACDYLGRALIRPQDLGQLLSLCPGVTIDEEVR